MLKEKILNSLNYLGLTFVLILAAVLGFYFGFKTRDGQVSPYTASSADIQLAANQVQKQEIKALEVEGVFWIKPNNDPVCPPSHQVKGTFTSTGGFFYTKDNKTWERVKPDICFATEDFAREKAGFIKKF